MVFPTLLNPVFAIVLRAALESDSVRRGEYKTATSRMITQWIEPQLDPCNDPNPQMADALLEKG